MTYKTQYILTIIALAVNLCSSAAGKTRFFNYCVELPSDTLIAMGRHYAHEAESPTAHSCATP